MAKHTDTQLIVLSKAAARDDGLASVPDGLNKAAASKVGTSLVSRKLLREVRCKPGMPAWREDEEGRGTSLVITREGREAIGIAQHEDSSSGMRKAGTARVRIIGKRALQQHAQETSMSRGPDRSRRSSSRC